MNWKTLLLGIFLLLLLLAGTKSESLWIDEGDTAYYATQQTFAAWKGHLLTDTNADCQFPLYMFGVWAWEKIAGNSEYALRAANAILALLALASFGIIGRQLGFRYLWALLLIQPFFWFYLNEARPYMLQISAGAVLLAGFVSLKEKRGTGLGWLLFFTGTVLLYYATLLSFITLSAFYGVVGIMVLRKEIALPKKWVAWGILLTLALAPGAIYYLQTVLRGVGGAKIWAVSPLNFIWVYYEIIGGVGLGPPVWQIREIARSMIHSGMSLTTFTPFLLAAVLVLGIGWIFISSAWNVIKQIKKESLQGNLFVILSIMLASIIFAFAGISIILKKAFWARHLSPVFPVYLLLLYGALHFLMADNRGIARRVFGFLLIGLLTISSFQVVCSKLHAKDDYRGAAQMAKESLKDGGHVWWAGSWHCGAYYGLPISEGVSTSPHLILLQDNPDSMLRAQSEPDLILISRSDVYDGNQTINSYALANGFHQSDSMPHIFKVWER